MHTTAVDTPGWLAEQLENHHRATVARGVLAKTLSQVAIIADAERMYAISILGRATRYDFSQVKSPKC